MTNDDRALPDDLPEDDLDGHTIEELADYLDRGRTPIDPSIEGSATCRLAMANMQRLRELSLGALERRVETEPERETSWVDRLLAAIRAEVRPGRDVPVAHPDPRIRLAMTEAAVRGLIRRAGDSTGGVVMGRCVLDGDLERPGATVRIDVTAGLFYGHAADDTADRLRATIAAAVERHTELHVEAVDVRFDDVYLP